MQHWRVPPAVPAVDRHRTAYLATPRAIKAFRVLALQLSYKPLEARTGRLGHRDVDRLVARQNVRRGLMRRELIAAHRSPYATSPEAPIAALPRRALCEDSEHPVRRRCRGGKWMAAERGAGGNTGGIGLGGILVIVGIVLMIVWSFWVGLIVLLVGLIAFGGFAKGKWY